MMDLAEALHGLRDDATGLILIGGIGRDPAGVDAARLQMRHGLFEVSGLA